MNSTVPRLSQCNSEIIFDANNDPNIIVALSVTKLLTLSHEVIYYLTVLGLLMAG